MGAVVPTARHSPPQHSTRHAVHQIEPGRGEGNDLTCEVMLILNLSRPEFSFRALEHSCLALGPGPDGKASSTWKSCARVLEGVRVCKVGHREYLTM